MANELWTHNETASTSTGLGETTGETIGNKRGLHTNEIGAGKVDETNSSIKPLADSAVFTGLAVDVSSFSNISVFVDTDKNGTLSMEFSIDGEDGHWDRKEAIDIDQAISSGSPHTLEVIAQYFRVVYMNSTGNGDQGHLRLQTILHKYKSGFITTTPNEIISHSNDVQIVRVVNDPTFDLSRGLYADKKSFRRFGQNGTVPNGSFADIWDYGPTDPTYNWPTTNEKFRVKAGGNAADTSDGAGARTIQIAYLDDLGNEVQDQLTLAGALVSNETTVTGRRFIRAFVDTCGTILSNNTGNIIIENVTSGQVVGQIAAGKGQTLQSMFTVPLNYTAYLRRVEIDVAVGTNKDADVIMWQRTNAYVTSAPFGVKRIVKEWDAIQGEAVDEFKALPIFAPLTDLWFEGLGNGAATSIDVEYDLFCVLNEVPTTPQ